MIHMQWNDGANHKGPCTLQLMDLSGTTIIAELGTVQNCAQSILPASQKGVIIPAEMKYTLPNEKKCAEGCLLHFSLKATHISESNPELYSNMAQIKISDNGAVGDPHPIRYAVPNGNFPFLDSGYKVTGYTSDDVQTARPTDPKPHTPPQVITKPPPTPIKTYNSPTTPRNGGSCTPGAYTCAGAGFKQCANGAWVSMQCAAGTSCTELNGSIVCDFAKRKRNRF